MRTPASSVVDETDRRTTTAVAERPPNLQDAFAAFVRARNQKPKAAATPGACATSKPNLTPQQAAAREERRARLRALFVETARGFIGVPYARKHHDRHYCACEGCSTSGRQLYHAPLFLDCCGLVRRVARALQAHLGFRLGPGNQAYQYDTLPVRLESVAQLKPGDLIFYSGTYCQPGSRRHAFDMTHVEIFVGGATGEATIGSRERYKWVMQYDSYRFESQRWSLLAHHFCSLDPWLDGLCVPQHPQLWTPRARHCGGGSGTAGRKAKAILGQQQDQEQGQGQQQLGPASSRRAWASAPGVVARCAVAQRSAWDGGKYSIFGGRRRAEGGVGEAAAGGEDGGGA